MSQLDIQTDTEGRFIALSGNFIKQTKLVPIFRHIGS